MSDKLEVGWAGFSQTSRSVYRRLRPYLAKVLIEGGLPRIITREMIEGGKVPELDLHYYGCSECYNLSDPTSYGEVPEGIRLKIGTHSVPRPFVFEIPQIELVGPYALPIAPDGRYLLEPLLGSPYRFVDAVGLCLVDLALPVRTPIRGARNTIEGPVFSLVGPWNKEFFHWFSDYLTRLEALAHYEKITGEKPAILIPENPPDWLTDSLELLNIDPSRCVEWANERAVISRLVVGSARRHTQTSGPRNDHIHSPRSLRQVGMALREAVNPVGDSTSRLYVSRELADDRRIVNEGEVNEVLSKFDFRKVLPEAMSLREQIEIFSTADVILGPHGAGMINMIYSDDATVIELFGSYQNPCFFAIANGLGHEYGCLQCEPARADIVVNPSRMEALLSKMIQ